MVLETKAKSMPVGFLDSKLMSMSSINQDRSYVVTYVTKASSRFSRKKLIMFAHNTIGHWILVVSIAKWKKALYFDLERSKVHDYSVLKEVLNE
jgi:amino-acid N-acetyltransferase